MCIFVPLNWQLGKYSGNLTQALLPFFPTLPIFVRELLRKSLIASFAYL
jgi:hypothetical protein